MSTAGASRVPGRPLLVFDGDCGFCTTAAGFGSRRLGLDHVEPWQLLDLAAVGLTEEQCRRAVQWVAQDGTIASAELAVIAALRHAGGMWRALGRALAVPGVRHVAGVLYRFVARHRNRMPGGTAACRLPAGRE